MDPLLPSFRRELRARAHHLHPVVIVGQHGLTPGVLHEIDVALTAHELIKVRVGSDDRADREAMLARICEQTACTSVQHLGKQLILWRRREDAAKDATVEKLPRRTRVAKKKPATKARASSTASSAHAAPDAGRRRRRSAGANTPEPVQERRRAPQGKAPQGVPRAAAPRRRRVR